VSAASVIRVKPAPGSSNDELFVTFDGQSGHSLEAEDEIVIERAAPVRLVRASTRSYFDVLRQKLKWSER
jgi:NAD+ kinase